MSNYHPGNKFAQFGDLEEKTETLSSRRHVADTSTAKQKCTKIEKTKFCHF